MTDTVIVVSPDGDLPLPSDIREELDWAPGTRLRLRRAVGGVFLSSEEKKPLVRPTRFEDVRGMLEYDGPPVTVEDMNRGIEEEARRRYARGRY